MSAIKLYTADICPFAQRAAIALHQVFKGQPGAFETVQIDLTNKPEWYLSVHPQGKVPALQTDSSRVLIESAVITEYVLEKYGTDQHWPKDPEVRARMKIFISQFNDTVTPKFYSLLKAKEPEQAQKETQALNEALENIEKVMKSISEGPFVFGETFSLADILTVTFLLRFAALKHYRNYEIPQRFARVLQWVAACKAVPAVKETTASDELYIEGYKVYAV